MNAFFTFIKATCLGMFVVATIFSVCVLAKSGGWEHALAAFCLGGLGILFCFGLGFLILQALEDK